MTNRWRLVAAALMASLLAVSLVVATARLPLERDAIRFLIYLPWLGLALAAGLALLFGRYGALLFVLLLTTLYILAGLAVTTAEAVALRELVAASTGVVLLLLAVRPEPWSPAVVLLLTAALAGAGLWFLHGNGGPGYALPVLPDFLPRGLHLPASVVASLVLFTGSLGLLLRILIGRRATLVGILTATSAVTAALYTASAPMTAEIAWAVGGLAVAVALVLESHRMAYRDELTGLPGRRALMERLERPGRRYSVGMVDVDHFKSFNDTHGHEAGDQVLRYVASRLARGTNGVRAFRYGGEEFTLLFPGSDLDRARPLAEALRAAIADAPFNLREPKRDPERRGQGGGQAVAVTVSLGLAQRRRGERPASVLERADAALYRAKGDGRNRVVADTGGS